MIFYSDIEPIYYILPIAGLLVGLFGTILGGGGGFFFLPILTLLIHVPAQTAVTTSLVATLPICVVGLLGYFSRGNINSRIGLLFALAGIFGAFIGAGITSKLSSVHLRTSFGIYSIVIALHIIVSTRKKKRAKTKGTEMEELPTLAKITRGSFFGFFAGIITGTFGTCGTAPVLAGLFAMRMPLKLVIGTSLMVVLVNTIFAIGAHFFISKIDLTLVYFLTAGSVVGALVGPKFLSKVKTDYSENKIRYFYAGVMILMAIIMIIG